MNPKRKEKLPWRELDGRAVIIHPQKNQVHELNPVATLIWKNVDGSRSVESLAALIELEFETSTEQVLGDVKDFLIDLKNRELLYVDSQSV